MEFAQLQTPDHPRARRSASIALVGLTVVGTGAAGLIYQVAWQRHLQILVGVDHAATATTLAIFLAGLSLGYALCGRWSARTRHPLRTYAALELSIGLWGLAFPWIFAGVSRLAESWSFSRMSGLVAGSLAAAVLLILVPALLMGATVPFLTRALAATRDGLTGTHAWVYGMNTLGAVAGTLLAGFYLLPVLGLDRTIGIAATLNLVAALVLALLSLPALHPGEPPGIRRPARSEGARHNVAVLALLAALGGAVTMCQENVLIRLLSLVIGGTPFAFALVVAAFVAAIASGSFVVARARRIPRSALSVCCSVAALSWLALYTTVDSWSWVAHVVRVAVQPNGPGFALYIAAVWSLLLLVLLPAVAPLGAVLPLVFHEHRATVTTSGKVSGGLLGWNALGALAGSLGGGLLLFHWLDLGRVLLIGPLVAALMALLASRAAGRGARYVSAALIGVTLIALILRPAFDPARLATGTFLMREALPRTFDGPSAFHEGRMLNRRIAHQEDGPLASVAVVESPTWDLPLPRPLAVYVNGRSESHTLQDRETLRLSAHLPALFATRRQRVLVIGQGTGVSAGEMTLWPEVESIDLVEVSPEVARALPLLASQTRSVHEDPRLTLHVEDARHLLRRDGKPWDLIVSEPSNPWIAGVDLLFTAEFFRSVESRLADGGLLLQWVQLYDTDEEIVCTIVRTIADVFPHLRAFRGSAQDWLLVASRSPLGAVDFERARKLYDDHDSVRASLGEIGVESFDALLEREVTPFPLFVQRAVSDCAPHVAGSTHLAYLARRAMFRGTAVFEPALFSPRQAVATGKPPSPAPD